MTTDNNNMNGKKNTAVFDSDVPSGSVSETISKEPNKLVEIKAPELDTQNKEEKPQADSQSKPQVEKSQAGIPQTGIPSRTPRRKRKPIGTGDILSAPRREGYVRRFVNDTKGGQRIQNFLDAGYEFVFEDTKINDGNKVAGDSTQVGTRVSRTVGMDKDDNPLVAYLMEQTQENYDEDQKAKLDVIDKTEESMRRRPGTTDKEGLTGKVDIG